MFRLLSVLGHLFSFGFTITIASRPVALREKWKRTCRIQELSGHPAHDDLPGASTGARSHTRAAGRSFFDAVTAG